MRLRTRLRMMVGVGWLWWGAGAWAGGGSVEPAGRKVLDELAAHGFAAVEARFAPVMKAAMPVEKLGAFWTQLEAQAGAFQAVESARAEPRGKYQVALLRARFARAPLDVTISFDEAGLIAGLFVQPAAEPVPWSPPPYAAKAVEERPLAVAGLPGHLTLPAGPGPFPALVLVHGSGPHDADETVGANQPFRDLALGLAAHGVAVLRYDKRTKVHPEAFALERKYTVKDEVLDDAHAALAALGRQPEIDPKRLFVLGHSLGGYLLPRLAEGEPQLAGLVILAGSTRPLEDLVVEQVRLLAHGEPQAIALAEASRQAIRDPKLAPSSVVDLLGAKLPGSYFLDLRGYDPAARAARLTQPLLVLAGGRDYQVPRADYDGWARALSHKPTATLKLYPALNHLFIAGHGEPGPAEYQQPGHVAEEVIVDLARFVTGTKAR